MSNETNFPNNSNHPQSANIPVSSLAPFKRFCCSLGMIPASYKASMSYEEQLMWLCDYLENTVIPTVNNNTDATNELQTLFNELHDYVEHYFDNLDVQQEINNKLDTMSEDGSLITIIAPYLQPFIDEQNQAINNAITQQNGRISQVENFVQASTNINPLVASTISGMTDTSRIYVLTTDGHWYYWNGTQWTDGGVYQAVELEENSVSYDALNENIQNSLEGVYIDENTYDTTNEYITNAGSLVTDSNYQKFSAQIDVEPYEIYYIRNSYDTTYFNSGSYSSYVILDENDTVIANKTITQETGTTILEDVVTIPKFRKNTCS